MNKELIDFQRECEINGFPLIYGENMVCLLNDKYLYSDDEVYTLEELFDINEENNRNDYGWDWDIMYDGEDYIIQDSPNTDLTL